MPSTAQQWLSNAGATIKSIVKIAIQSRRCTVSRIPTNEPDTLIIMGNGPSLADTIANDAAALKRYPTMAVNFAANADEFYGLKPRYYVLADPVFFAKEPHVNTVKLWENLATRIDWPMTLFVPATQRKNVPAGLPLNIKVEQFNNIGVEGFRWIENAAFSSGRGMPRPRNVLIVSLMVAIKMGYNRIYLTGADHSWTRTLEVRDDNMVVSIQPHFYKDNDEEHARVASVYKDIRLHELMYSFYVAFRSYFAIERYARAHGIDIFNATPGSFIDAFRRQSLKECDPN